MHSRTSSTHEEPALRLAAEPLFFTSTQLESLAMASLNRSDFWATVMSGCPVPPATPSLPDPTPKPPQVEAEEEAVSEYVPEAPRRNPPRAAKHQEPLPRGVSEDESLDKYRPERPSRHPPCATKSREAARPTLPGSRHKRPAEDKTPGDKHVAKRSHVDPPTIPAIRTENEPQEKLEECPYEKPLLPFKELVIQAVLRSPHERMTVEQINSYFRINHPWNAWKRRTQTLNKKIVDVLRPGRSDFMAFEQVPEQPYYWRLTATYQDYLRSIRPGS